MDRKTLARIATMSVMLGVATVACTPSAQMAHPAALADQAPRQIEIATREAARAKVALAQRKGVAAVDAAEKAVAARPEDASYRMLLGQAYLAAGRFASAETSFRDSLTLSPDQPRARLNLALAEIAGGRSTEAQQQLHALADGAIPVSDLGLALALAGDRQSAIQMLTDLIRSGKSDARSRQNLALAFALDGRWREARAVAMQDTPADRINDQIGRWAELARPQTGGTVQVAAMLGVKPASDPGLPTMLALAAPSPVGAPVALAAADPIAPQVAPPAPVIASAPAPVPTIAAQADRSVTVALDDPVMTQTPADAPAAAVVLAARQSSTKRSDLAPPPLLRATQSPIRRAIVAAPDVPVAAPSARSGDGWFSSVPIRAPVRSRRRGRRRRS